MKLLLKLLKNIPRFSLIIVPALLFFSGISIDIGKSPEAATQVKVISTTSKNARKVNLKEIPNGKIWHDGIVISKNESLILDYEKPITISKLEIQADHNDTYKIEYSINGENFASLWTVPEVFLSGLQTRHSDFFDNDKKIKQLRISASDGDNFYSISNVKVYKEKTQISLGLLALVFAWILWLVISFISKIEPNGLLAKFKSSLSFPFFDLAFGLYIAGVLIRFAYILFIHPAAEYIYSDMSVYAGGALNILNPDYKLTVWDSVMPKGMSYFLAFFYQFTGDWSLCYLAQFIISCLVPIILWDTGKRIYSNKTGTIALIISSIYFPYIEYPAFFLSEGPMIFSILIWFYFIIRTYQAKTINSVILFAFLSGISIGAAMSLKGVALATAVIAYPLLLFKLRKTQSSFYTFSAVLIGIFIVIFPLSLRMTEASEGRFTLVSRNAALNVLLGHHGYISGAQFNDPNSSGNQTWGPTAHVQRGYNEVIEIDVASYETGKLLKRAWDWSVANPLDALLLSFNHIYDLFFAHHWPSIATKSRRWADLAQQLFVLFILFPAVVKLIFLFNKGVLKISTPELIMLSLCICIVFISFLTIGSPRIRIPFDAFFILLAATQYSSYSNLTSNEQGSNSK